MGADSLKLTLRDVTDDVAKTLTWTEVDLLKKGLTDEELLKIHSVVYLGYQPGERIYEPGTRPEPWVTEDHMLTRPGQHETAPADADKS